MEQLFLWLASAGEYIIEAGWLPLLIWTLLGFAVWAALRSSDRIHPEYQYHARLALIFSLPAGFVFLMLVEFIPGWISAQAAETGLKIISVTAPIEFSVAPAESSASIPPILYAYVFVMVVLAGGMAVTIARFLRQCLQLRTIRNRCSFQPITKLQHISRSNIGLALSVRRPVMVAFLQQDVVPVTFGLRRPVILLPESLKSQPDKMNLALRHELTHIRQHDFFSHLLVVVTQAMFWFHPLVHKLRRELVEYREMRCDYMVLSEKSVSRKEYATLLLELIPMPNIDKDLSVNMAQESSNLKKRITMITRQSTFKPIPQRSSLALLGAVFLSVAIVMACTDMQTQTVFDEEELNLMTDVDRTGERGYHQILIYMSEDEQADRYRSQIDQLRVLQPEHISRIDILRGNQAVENFGSRAEHGVIVIRTHIRQESYNAALRVLGMESESISPAPEPMENGEPQDYFVVVEDMPELIGGLASLQREIRYPEMARRAGIEGRVYVQFVINEQGGVENARVIRGIGGGADEEALRVVNQARFKPGMQRGRPVRVQYSLPIFFRLQGSETTPEQTSLEPRENSLNEMTISGYGGNDDARAQVEPENSVLRNLGIHLWNTENGVRGTVMDARTNEPLAGANVVVRGTNIGTATDLDGNFTISNSSLDIHSTVFEVSYVGYRTLQSRVQE
jgi:TonB family protein